MKRNRSSRSKLVGRLRAVSVALLASTAALSAQPADSPESGFGPDDQVVNIPFSGFASMTSAVFSPGTHYCCDDGYQFSFTGTSGFAIMNAPVDAGLIPNGATISQFAAYVGDSTGLLDENFRISLCRTWVDSVDGQNPAGDCPISVETFSSPNDTVLTFAPVSPLRVLYREDVDNDGQLEVVSYNVVVEFGINTKLRDYFGEELKLRQVRFVFKRSVSPSPAVATFNDVPTDHPFFQFVEALVKSSITAGCGGGNFCPDAPLTRGQMAVFLAKSLGLSWEY